RRDKFDLHEFDGEQLVYLTRGGGLKHPRTQETLTPRLLGAKQPATEGDPLQTLADWVADPANPFFAKAQANRVWFHLMGRGLVEPI
ncbi:DUF1553 domain-containing protein, partial [Klebsiella pneumoniae]|nr:DUF1553 domain-containing protein [Klebsiella pneumoniae]